MESDDERGCGCQALPPTLRFSFSFSDLNICKTRLKTSFLHCLFEVFFLVSILGPVTTLVSLSVVHECLVCSRFVGGLGGFFSARVCDDFRTKLCQALSKLWQGLRAPILISVDWGRSWSLALI